MEDAVRLVLRVRRVVVMRRSLGRGISLRLHLVVRMLWVGHGRSWSLRWVLVLGWWYFGEHENTDIGAVGANTSGTKIQTFSHRDIPRNVCSVHRSDENALLFHHNSAHFTFCCTDFTC